MPSGSAAARAQQIAQEEAAHTAEENRTGVRKLFVPGRAANAIPDGNNVDFDYASIEEAFPDVDPGIGPLGSMVLVMIRQPKLRVAGSTLLAEARKTEHDNTQVAKVIALGALAFMNRETAKPWPEGVWCHVGDFIRVPKYMGDRWSIAYTREDAEVNEHTGTIRRFPVTDYVHFVLFKDLAILGKYPDAAAALAAKAFY
jgi:co-chaperonin GroES (HSP10)